MKAAVIFYSKTGNTKKVAIEVAKNFDAKMLELEPKKKPFPLKAMWTGKSELLDDVYNKIGAYDTLFILTPIWIGNTTPPINTLIKKGNFKGKNIYVITVQGDEKLNGSKQVIRKIKRYVEKTGGKFIKGSALQGKTIYNSEKTAKQIEKRFPKDIDRCIKDLL